MVGRAVLEGDVEGAGLAAARLAHQRDAVVEGRHALEDGCGVVQRASVHGDEVPVGEGLGLQRATVRWTSGPASWAAITTVTAGEVPTGP